MIIPAHGTERVDYKRLNTNSFNVMISAFGPFLFLLQQPCNVNGCIFYIPSSRVMSTLACNSMKKRKTILYCV